MFRFDRSDLNFGFAAAGSFVAAVLIWVLIEWGGGTGSGLFGFVLTGLVFAAVPTLSLRNGATFGLIGGVLTLWAFTASGEVGWSALVLGLVSAVSALATARSPGAATSWWLLAVWTLVAFVIVEEGAELVAAASFAVGSLLALALISALRRRANSEPVPSSPKPTNRGAATWFAVGKGIAVAIGVVVGFAWFPAVPYWVALTVLIVAHAADRTTMQRALSRSLGTLLGVGLAALTLTVAGTSELWTATFLVGIIFGAMLFLRVDYTLYTLFLTALIVVGASFTTDDVGDVGWMRIVATVIGAAMALALTEIVTRFGKSRPAAG